jgi:nicotinamidase-related amidase
VTLVLGTTALLVIDMQAGFDAPAWGHRNNPQLETRVAHLLAVWRGVAGPVVHVHHDSPQLTGRLRPGTPGNAAKPCAQPAALEPLYRKRTNSAFIGTSLDADLRETGIQALAIIGLTTNHCISTTARMAGNLGYRTFVLSDATAAFAGAHLDGRLRSPTDVHDAALSDLEGEFAEVVTSTWLIDTLLRSTRHA